VRRDVPGPSRVTAGLAGRAERSDEREEGLEMLRMGMAGAETDVENDIHSKGLVVVECERGGGRWARRTSGTMRTTVEVVVGNIKNRKFGCVCPMAGECGICLDPLKKPVSVPCGA
jgi:hypothetical protein